MTCAELANVTVECRKDDLRVISDHMNDKSRTKTERLHICVTNDENFLKAGYFLPTIIVSVKATVHTLLTKPQHAERDSIIVH